MRTKQNVPKDLIDSQNHFVSTYGYRTIEEERYDRLNKVKKTITTIAVAVVVAAAIGMMLLLQKVYG